MKKVLTLLVLVVILIAMVGYAIFYFGTNIASERVMETVTSELESSGQMDEVKSYIENDPTLRQFVEDAENVDESTLPFTTKEQATRVLIRKVGITELQSIQSQATQGTLTQEEVIAKLEENLTQEEITALKVIAYKEIYKQ